jgi:hypothetical protein
MVRFIPTAAQYYSQNIIFTGGAGTTKTVTGTGQEIVGWWKFNETSGSMTYDSSVFGNHGTLNGPVWTGTGELRFDGINDYVSVPDSNTLDLTNALTISVWVKLEAYGASWSFPKLVTKPYDVADTDPWELYCIDLGPQGTYPRFILSAGTSGSWVGAYDSGKILSLNQWHQLVGTYDGTTMSLYIDGQLAATTATNIQIGQNTMPLSIGGNLGSYGFKGLIGDVKIYNRGLSAVEVQTLYQNP